MNKELGPLCACGCGEHVNWSRKKGEWFRFKMGHGLRGKQRSKETRKKMSEANLRRWRNPEYQRKMQGVNCGSIFKSGYREDLGYYVRSSWEANFARLLMFLGVDFEYEPKRFVMKDEEGRVVATYLPDFFLTDLNRYVELKGRWDDFAREKVELFRRIYPSVILDVVESADYRRLESKFSGLIPNWE